MYDPDQTDVPIVTEITSQSGVPTAIAEPKG